MPAGGEDFELLGGGNDGGPVGVSRECWFAVWAGLSAFSGLGFLVALFLFLVVHRVFGQVGLDRQGYDDVCRGWSAVGPFVVPGELEEH